MDLNNLYNLAEKENIKIYDWYIENAYGIFLNIDKINEIGKTLVMQNSDCFSCNVKVKKI